MSIQEQFEDLILQYKNASELQQRAIVLRLAGFPRTPSHRPECNCVSCRRIRKAKDDPSKVLSIRMAESEVEALKALGAERLKEHLLTLLQN